MQINGFPNPAMLGAYRTGAKTASAAKKTSQTHGMSFDLMVRNEQPNKAEQTDKTAAAAPLTPEEEMAAFKQEIYEELAEIDKMNSSAVLSNSVHITEGGFKRMKEDPAYRKEIMDWLRADARASHGLPYSTHSTTVINEVEARTRAVSNDLYRKDPATKQLFDSKKDDAFYYSERKAAQRKRDSELMQKMMLEKHIDQKAQRQALDQRILAQNVVDQKYVQDYLLGMQESKSWNI